MELVHLTDSHRVIDRMVGTSIACPGSAHVFGIGVIGIKTHLRQHNTYGYAREQTSSNSAWKQVRALS